MTEIDREPFAAALFALGDTFNEPMTRVRAEGYFDALSDYTLPQVNAAVRLSLRRCKFFPKPAELRELIEGDAEAASDAAWGAVLREIRRVGYIGTPDLEERTLRAIRELWGSWQRLCERLPAEGPELLGWIKQFKQVYGSVERTEHRALGMGDLHPNVRSFIEAKQKRLK
jgi:hypothetical protein